MSFTIGPFAISLERSIFLLAFAVALLVGWLVGHRRQIRVEPILTQMLIFGLISGRLTFVLIYLDEYLTKPFSIIDIRDGGFFLEAGLLVAVLVGVFYGWRGQAIRVPLSSAVAAGMLTWIVGIGLTGLLHSSQPRMPIFVLTDLQGKPQTLSELQQGRPMVVNIWATWCPPCRREMPVLEEAQQDYGDVMFVLINQGESNQTVARYLETEQLQLHNVLLDLQSNTTRQMGVRALPTTFFFDADGQLVNTHFGELSAATLKHRLRPLTQQTRN